MSIIINGEQKSTPEMCDSCGVNPAGPIRVCEYDDEIGSGYKFCNCCPDCRHECAMDI